MRAMIERNSKGQFVKGAKPVAGFKKGFTPWNKDKKGLHLSQGTEFKKGMTPWNKGRKLHYDVWNKDTGKGYIDIRGYKCTPKEKLEHRVIVEKILNRPLKSSEVVHHVNGVRDDNRQENLQYFKNNAAHTRLHWFAKRHNLDMQLFRFEWEKTYTK